MKIKKSERKLYIPSKVKLPKLILSKYNDKTYLYHHQDKYAYVLSKIIELKIFAKPKKNGFVSLHAETLSKILGGTYYKDIIQDLLDWNVIITDNHYKEGEESKGYNISLQYQSKAVEIMILKETFAANLKRRKFKTDSKPANYILSQLKNIYIHQKEALQYIEKKYEDTITLINSLSPNGLYNQFKQAIEDYEDVDFYTIKDDIKYDQFLLNDREILKGVITEKYNSDLLSIQHIMDRNFCFKVDENSGRVYTFITNLSRSLRQFLYHRKYPDTPLVNIDIRNSQPFIFCSLLKEYYYNGLPQDVQEYIQLCSDGMLYNFLMEEMDVKTSRKAFKQMLFACLFYCKNQFSDTSKKAAYFRNRFPKVYEVIYTLKFRDYKNLSYQMQKKEADIMIGMVVKRLMRSSVFLTTIHDSIICLEPDADLIKNTIQHYFNREYFLNPSLDADYLIKKQVVSTAA